MTKPVLSPEAERYLSDLRLLSDAELAEKRMRTERVFRAEQARMLGDKLSIRLRGKGPKR